MSGAGFLRVEAIWAFLAMDKGGQEGVCTALMPGWPAPVPLIAADEQRMADMLPYARRIARECDVTVRVVKMSSRTEMFAIEPHAGTA